MNGDDFYDPEGVKTLVYRVLLLAISDWLKVKNFGRVKTDEWLLHGDRRGLTTRKICALAREQGYHSPRDELIDFFAGDWAKELFEAADIDRDKAVKALRVPGKGVKKMTPQEWNRWWEKYREHRREHREHRTAICEQRECE